MKRVYIDFDSTLYDTAQIKKTMNDIIANGVCENSLKVTRDIVFDEIKKAPGTILDDLKQRNTKK